MTRSLIGHPERKPTGPVDLTLAFSRRDLSALMAKQVPQGKRWIGRSVGRCYDLRGSAALLLTPSSPRGEYVWLADKRLLNPFSRALWFIAGPKEAFGCSASRHGRRSLPFAVHTSVVNRHGC